MSSNPSQSAVLNGFTVSIQVPDSAYEAGHPDDILIFIDTPQGFDKELRIRINDSLIYKANPDHPETVEHNETDGFFIVDK